MVVQINLQYCWACNAPQVYANTHVWVQNIYQKTFAKVHLFLRHGRADLTVWELRGTIVTENLLLYSFT